MDPRVIADLECSESTSSMHFPSDTICSSLLDARMTASHDVISPLEDTKTTKSLETPIDEKKQPVATDLELVPSERHGEIVVISESEYTPLEYKKMLRKIDRFLLPLMWFCYGVQQTDKTSLGTQAIFGLREDTGLVDQEYNWLTTIFCK